MQALFEAAMLQAQRGPLKEGDEPPLPSPSPPQADNAINPNPNTGPFNFIFTRLDYLETKFMKNRNNPAESPMLTGKVRIHAATMLFTVFPCTPDFAATIVPAIPDERT